MIHAASDQQTHVVLLFILIPNCPMADGTDQRKDK